jgi:hypothetical protein
MCTARSGSASSSSSRATVPPHLPPSTAAVVTIVTDAGVHASRGDLLAIVRDPAANPLPAGLAVAPGGTFTLTRTWNPGPHGLTVLINDLAAVTANATGNAVTFIVPTVTGHGPAQVIVVDAIGCSNPVTLTVT